MYNVPELWQMEMDQLKLEQGKEPDPVSWRWSPLDLYEFDQMLTIAHQLAIDGLPAGEPMRVLSFAEPGCGIGTKLYLAKTKYNMTEMGWDFNPEYLDKCRELGVTAELRDLSDLDSAPVWSAYDIVYTARPFKDDMFEVAWEQSVQEAMRPGAVLIAAFVARKPYHWPCFYRRPFRGIWVKPDHATGVEEMAAKTLAGATV